MGRSQNLAVRLSNADDFEVAEDGVAAGAD